MKYVDAEKLKAKIRKHLIPTVLDRDYDEWERGKDAGLQQAINIVESLQQKQPEIDFEVKFAEFLERKDAELGAKSWSEEDLRELALYFYYSKNDEQPEVDLEKQLCEYFEGWRINYHSETEELLKNNGCTVDMDDVKEIARHFWNKGYNARKEESK